eukprot:Nk52_evm16s1763 gene=Nk52_evmTU16s1763
MSCSHKSDERKKDERKKPLPLPKRSSYEEATTPSADAKTPMESISNPLPLPAHQHDEESECQQGQDNPNAGPVTTAKHVLLQDYDMVTSIEQGRYALLRHHQSQDFCFLKILVKGDRVMQSGLLMRRRDEIRLMQMLKHSSICSIRQLVETHNSLYMVCDYFPDSLETLECPLDLQGICLVFTAVVEGISYLQNKGISHNDLSPDKIRLTKENGVKICGFSKVTESPWCMTEEMTYSHACYQPPEARETNCSYDGFKAHIYSLGCILYYLMNGNTHPPFLGLENCLSEQIIKFGEDIPHWRKALYKLVRGMCRDEADERISLSEVLRQFKHHTGDELATAYASK